MPGPSKATKGRSKRQTLSRLVTFFVLLSFVVGGILIGGIAIYSTMRLQTPSGTSPSAQVQPDQDLARWQEAMKATPRDPFVLRHLAQALEAAGKTVEARSALEQAKIYSPKDYLNDELLGRFDLRQKRYKDAVSDFKSGLLLKPGDPDLSFELAAAYAGAGEDARAEALFRKVISENPNTQAAAFSRLSLLNLLLEKRDYAGAQKEAEALYRTDPSNPQLLMMLGEIAEKQNKNDLAVSYYQKAEKVLPGDSGIAMKTAAAEYAAALSSIKKGEKAKARELLDEASRRADSAKDEKLKGEIRAALQGL